MPMKRKTKVRIARFTRQVPILREMQALRNESVLRLVVQAAFVGGCTGGVIGVFRWLYDHGNAWIVSTLRHGADGSRHSADRLRHAHPAGAHRGPDGQEGAPHQRQRHPPDGIGAGRAASLSGIPHCSLQIRRDTAVPVRRPLRGARGPEHPDGRGRGLRFRTDLSKTDRRRSGPCPALSHRGQRRRACRRLRRTVRGDAVRF